MKSDVTFRAAEPEDAEVIIRLAIADFAPARRSLFVYACPGAVEWVRAQLALPHALRERRYTLAMRAADVVGVTDVTRGTGGLHLAYIAVAHHAQGQGIARRLLAASVRGEDTLATSQLGLDVFGDNARALEWYTRLGFRPEYEREWWVGDTVTSTTEVRGVIVSGMPSADAVHARFGFSQFDLLVADRRVAVGRLGAEWFRLGDVAAVNDDSVRAALAQLSPDRRLLVLIPAGAVPPGGFERVATSIRMHIAIPDVLAALEGGQ